MLALIHIEKTGGKTIARIMRREYGMRHCDVQSWSGNQNEEVFGADDYLRLRWLYPRLKSISGHAVRPYSDLSEACSGVRYYTMLRKPLERCAAHYNYQVAAMGKRVSFDEWILDSRFRNRQTYYLSGTQDADAAIEVVRKNLFFVGLSERYEESVVILAQRTCDPGLKTQFAPYQTSGGGAATRLLLADPLYRRYPDARIAQEILSDPSRRAKLKEANLSDLKLYDFVTRELFPRQVQEYGGAFDSDVKALPSVGRWQVVSFKWVLSRLKRNLLYKPALHVYRRGLDRSTRAGGG